MPGKRPDSRATMQTSRSASIPSIATPYICTTKYNAYVCGFDMHMEQRGWGFNCFEYILRTSGRVRGPSNSQSIRPLHNYKTPPHLHPLCRCNHRCTLYSMQLACTAVRAYVQVIVYSILLLVSIELKFPICAWNTRRTARTGCMYLSVRGAHFPISLDRCRDCLTSTSLSTSMASGCACAAYAHPLRVLGLVGVSEHTPLLWN